MTYGFAVMTLKTERHVLEALRDYATKPCHKSNCGTVCLCGSCHARAALKELDPDYDYRIHR